MIEFLMSCLDVYETLMRLLSFLGFALILIFMWGLCEYVSIKEEYKDGKECEEKYGMLYTISKTIVEHWKLIMTMIIIGFLCLFSPSKQTIQFYVVTHLKQEIYEKSEKVEEENLAQKKLLEKMLDESLESYKKDYQRKLETFEEETKEEVEKIQELEDLKNDLNKMK